MNALSPQPDNRRQIVQGAAAPSRAKKVSETLARIDETYLAPFRDFERLDAKVREPGSAAPAWSQIATFWLRRPEGGVVRSEEDRAAKIGELEGRLKDRPDPDEVLKAYDAFVAGRSTINHTQNRAIVALMIDAFPNARAHSPEAWMETVIKEVRVSEFSTLVVAKACNLLTRSETFAPSVGAVVERCELVREFVDHAIAGVENARGQREYYARCLTWLRETSPWDGNPDNRPNPLIIDMGFDPFTPKRSEGNGRVGYV